MKIIVLGCGFHGRGIAYELSESLPDADILVADKIGSRAQAVAEKIDCQWLELDIHDAAALRSALTDGSLVFNGVGPYHYKESGLRVVDAAIKEAVPCVDMSDDHEVAEALLLNTDWDKRAKDAGIAVITGTGIAPGVTGMMAKLGYQTLDSTDSIDIRFSWNYSLEYPAALQHFFRISSGQAPQFINAEYVRPGAFAEPELVEFLEPVGIKEVSYSGINDPVSLSVSLPGLTRVTAKGAYHQSRANDLLSSMIRWGFTSYDPLPGETLAPFEYLMQHLMSDQGRGTFDIPMEPIPMAARATVRGYLNGKPKCLNYEAHDFSRRATTSAAARVAVLLVNGKLEFTGVRAPEGCVDPSLFLKDLAEHPDIKFYAWDEESQSQPLVF
jgi:saccharopine dehydrogenase (NAD+, L-lysine-forming)